MSYNPEDPSFELPQVEEVDFVTFSDLGITDDAGEEETEDSVAQEGSSGLSDAVADNMLPISLGSVLGSLKKASPLSKEGTVKTSCLGPIGNEIDLDKKNEVLNFDSAPGWTKAGGHREKIALIVNYLTEKSAVKRSWKLVKGSGKPFVRVFIYNYTIYPIGMVEYALDKNNNFNIEIPPPQSKFKENFKSKMAYCFPIHPGALRALQDIPGLKGSEDTKASMAFQIWSGTVEDSPWFSLGLVYNSKEKKSYTGAAYGKSNWNQNSLKAVKEGDNTFPGSGYVIECASNEKDFFFSIKQA